MVKYLSQEKVLAFKILTILKNNLGTTNQRNPSDNELNVVLESYGLLDIGEKFLGARVTSDVIWDLSEDELKEDVGMTRIELRRFMKAHEKFKATKSQDIGEQASVDAYGRFHKVTVCIFFLHYLDSHYVHFVESAPALS